MKKIFSIMSAAAVILLISTTSFCDENNVLDLTVVEDEKSETVIVVLRGKINHAGKRYQDVVPGVHVWIAEYPESKDLKTVSDETGWWELKIKKIKGKDAAVSFIYEKEGWATTKSNAIIITDEDDTDLAIQYIDPEFYYGEIRTGVEKMIAALPGVSDDTKFENAMVATVGKTWASIHDDRLPHGDPGATCGRIRGAAGPIYFDESVRPNPTYTETSVDGGVAWINVPPGTHTVTASREGVEYAEVTFIIEETDTENGIDLYIASPPDSIQGTNQSNPGSHDILTGEKAMGASDLLAEVRAVIEFQKQLIIDGDIETLKQNLTERLRDMITEEMVKDAPREVESYGIEDLVQSIEPGEYQGKETIKIKMSNGRTLTTLVRHEDKWLADTIWFR